MLWCPAGPGHVLLVQAELTGGKPRVYSDNIGMTRWLQRTIESILFPPSGDPALMGVAHIVGGDALDDEGGEIEDRSALEAKGRKGLEVPFEATAQGVSAFDALALAGEIGR